MTDKCYGSLHDPNNYTGPDDYKPVEFCVGEWNLSAPECDLYQEQLAQENLNISGDTINIFKLLGVHEQGKLVDTSGLGKPLNNTGAVFSGNVSSWISMQRGIEVLTSPAWIGYDFGVLRTSYGASAYEPAKPNVQDLSSFRITQPSPSRRVLQVRIERSDGDFYASKEDAVYTCVGNGTVTDVAIGRSPRNGHIMLMYSGDVFQVFFAGEQTQTLGVVRPNNRFVTDICSFTISAGTIPFADGDMISIPVSLVWKRVDVVNIPNQADSGVIRFNQSRASRYWRIVPTMFSGVQQNQPWEVDSLELFDYAVTRLDDIQDALLMENRDRDYDKSAISLKVARTAIDTVTSFNKFGFDMDDSFIFTTTFAGMVLALGRPIVIGDIIEVPSEVQYDHNLKPVRKFLEVTDVGWSADGRTTSWRPIIYKIQASRFMPGQEHRDLFGTMDTQLYAIDDSDFFRGQTNQIQTAPLVVAERNEQEAESAVPEIGINLTEVAQDANKITIPERVNIGLEYFIEDGMPPDGAPYTEGFALPDVAGVKDGVYFRLNYDAKMKIPSRLYKFSAVKNKWIYMETDRRHEQSSHKPSQNELMTRTTQLKNGLRQLPPKEQK